MYSIPCSSKISLFQKENPHDITINSNEFMLIFRTRFVCRWNTRVFRALFDVQHHNKIRESEFCVCIIATIKSEYEMQAVAVQSSEGHAEQRARRRSGSANRRPVGVLITNDVLEKLDDVAWEIGITRSAAMSVAVHAWLDGKCGVARMPGDGKVVHLTDRPRVYVTLHPDVIDRIDERVKGMKVARSAAITAAIAGWLGMENVGE